MDHLDDISVEKLQDALDNVEGKEPTERLLAAIAYKNGVAQAELAEWYDVQRRTIYNWLKRLDADESLEYAVVDVIILEEKGNYQNNSNKISKKLSTTYLKPSAPTRRRGRRRSSSNFSRKYTTWSTHSRVAGSC